MKASDTLFCTVLSLCRLRGASSASSPASSLWVTETVFKMWLQKKEKPPAFPLVKLEGALSEVPPPNSKVAKPFFFFKDSMACSSSRCSYWRTLRNGVSEIVVVLIYIGFQLKCLLNKFGFVLEHSLDFWVEVGEGRKTMWGASSKAKSIFGVTMFSWLLAVALECLCVYFYFTHVLRQVLTDRKLIMCRSALPQTQRFPYLYFLSAGFKSCSLRSAVQIFFFYI